MIGNKRYRAFITTKWGNLIKFRAEKGKWKQVHVEEVEKIGDSMYTVKEVSYV